MSISGLIWPFILSLPLWLKVSHTVLEDIESNLRQKGEVYVNSLCHTIQDYSIYVSDSHW